MVDRQMPFYLLQGAWYTFDKSMYIIIFLGANLEHLRVVNGSQVLCLRGRGWVGSTIEVW